MNVRSAYSNLSVSLTEKCSHGIVGTRIDERTEISIDHVKNNVDQLLEIKYNKSVLNVSINGKTVECHDLSEYLMRFNIKSIMLDATSLDIPELALVLNSVKKHIKSDVLIVYFEPSVYSSRETGALDMEEFGLSDEILGFEGAGIPTISLPVNEELSRKFVIFVGFEAGRLQSAIETYDISSEEAKIFFGIPAFQPGWEAKSIRRNIPILNEQSFRGRIGYCSASNISDALRTLDEFGEFSDDCLLYVLPLGTKPNSIAAIIYAIENSEHVRMLYDQPNKREGRSQGVGRRHYYYYKVS